MDEKVNKRLWVRIKGRTGTGDILVGVSNRSLKQDDQPDESLYRQIGAASHLQALVLVEDFSNHDVCWRDNKAGHKQSRTFLEYVDDNFLLQVIKEPRRRGAILDLILTNKEGLVRNMKFKTALAAVTMKWQASRSLGQQGGCPASSLNWTSGEHTSSSSGKCVVE